MLASPGKFVLQYHRYLQISSRLQIFNSWNSAADTRWNRINVRLCSVCACVCECACLCEGFVCLLWWWRCYGMFLARPCTILLTGRLTCSWSRWYRLRTWTLPCPWKGQELSLPPQFPWFHFWLPAPLVLIVFLSLIFFPTFSVYASMQLFPKKENNLTLYCSKYANRKSHVSYALFGVCLFQCPAAKPLTFARWPLREAVSVA